MPILETADTTLIPADQITVRPGRQRSKLSVEDLKESIGRIGLLHPVVVRQVGGEIVLVAGERRRQACLELGLLVPIRFFSDLTPVEADIAELEENLKRTNLDWKDEVKAVGRIHALYLTRFPDWKQIQTAEAIGLSKAAVTSMLTVFEHIHEDRITSQPTCSSAYNMITRANARIADVAITNLMEEANVAFLPTTAEAIAEPQLTPPPAFVPPIVHGDFLSWAPTYDGPKFNLIHCDFPYGIGVFRPGGHIGMGGSAQVEYGDTEDTYFTLIECLMSNLDKLLSHSGHLMFWFSMQHYEKTRRALSHKKLIVLSHPLVWLRSDNAGVAPDPKRGPRQIYETAFLCFRGDRSIVKIVSNGYAGPSDKSIHPSAKPEPMLKHFFTMLVDGTTRLLDPTAGGGSAIRAAESLGSEFTYGLEINSDHVDNANAAVRKARILRNISRQATGAI